MANETLVSMPTKFEDFKQVRAFAVKLIEKLDIVLGYRGTVGYEEAGTAQALAEVTLTSLAETVEEFEQVLDAFREDLVGLSDSVVSFSDSVNQYKTTTAIADTSYTAPTVSGVYVQAEVQGIADSLETVSDKLDTLLGVLRNVEIIT